MNRLLNYNNIIILSILIFFGFFINGIIGLNKNDIQSFFPMDVLKVAIFLVPVIIFLRFKIKINYTLIFTLIITFISIIFGAFGSLFIAITFAISSYCLGAILKNLISINYDAHETSPVILILIGFSIFGTLINIFSHYPVNYPGLYAFLIICPIIVYNKKLLDDFNVFRKFIFSDQYKNSVINIFLILIATSYYLISLMPEVGHDALVHHLFIPASLAENHRWSFNPEFYVWAFTPSLGDWIYAMGFMLGGEQTSRLLNTEFLLIIALLIREMVLLSKASNFSALLAILIFFSTPLTFLENSTLYIESIWTAFIVAGSVLVIRFLNGGSKNSGLIIIAGIMLGAAASAKAVTFTILPVFFIVVSLYYIFKRVNKDNIKFNIRGYTISLCFFLLFGSLPYISAYVNTGNPFFPFFNDIFQSPFWPSVRFDSPLYGKGVSWTTLYDATFNTGRYLEAAPGAAGFQMLLLLIPAGLMLILSKNINAIIIYFIAIVSLVLCFQATAYLRYIFPSFVWFSAVFGVVYFEAIKKSKALKILVLIIVGISVASNLFFWRSATNYGSFSLKPLLSNSDMYEYVGNVAPIRNLVGIVNQFNKSNSPVPFFSQPFAAGLRSDALHPNWYNTKFQSIIFGANTKEEMAKVLDSYGVEYLILDSNWMPADKRVLVASATVPIYENGSLSIRVINRDYLFLQELLLNPGFIEIGGWSVPVKKKQGYVEVTAGAPTIQGVQVQAGRKYLTSVISKCADKIAHGRLQINWMDSENKFIKTDIKVFACSKEDKQEKMLVTAPPDAKTAIVFATGHTEDPILISYVSLKE